MNLRRIKGTTEDGEIIDEESMSKAEKALKDVQIPLREMKNGMEELRDPMVILEEIANKWEDLSTVEQSKLIEGLGGVYRGNQFVALMEGWETYEKTVGEFLDHNNSAIKENEIYMDSWEAKSKQLSASVAQMWQTTLNTDHVKAFIDGIRAIIEQLTAMGGLVPMISGLLGYLLVASIVKNVVALGGMAKTLGVVITALKSFNLSLAGTMLLTGGWIPILAGLVIGLGTYYAVTRRSKEETDEFNKAITLQTRSHKELREELDKNTKAGSDYLTEETSKIELADKLVDKLYEMSEGYNDTEIEMAKMIKLKDELKKLIPTLNIQIDKETGKIKEQETAVRDVIKAHKALVGVKAAEQASLGAYQAKFEAEVNMANEKIIIDRIRAKFKATGIPELENMSTDFTNIQGLANVVKRLPKDIAKEAMENYPVLQNALTTYAENEKAKKQAEFQLGEYGRISDEYTKEYASQIIEADVETEEFDYGGGDTKSIPEHLKAERYLQLNDALNKTRQSIQIYQNQLNALAEDDESRIPIKEKQIELMKQEQKQLHALANAQRARRDELFKSLSGRGVKFTGDGDNMTITNRDSLESQLRNRVNSLSHLGSDSKEYQATLKAYEDITESMEEFVDIQNEGIKGAQASWWGLQGSIVDTEDKIKDFYQKQKELAEEQAKEQEKLYNEKVEAVNTTELKIQEIIKHGVSKRKEALDDELDKLKDTTDKKIEQYEREWDAQDKEKRDKKQLNKISDIQNKINALSRDTSLAGIAERKELEKELAEELETMEENRENARRELIKRTLQDTVKFREDAVDKEKKELDDVWNHEKVTLKASEILRKQSFASLKQEFPELFEELRVSSDGFFSVFESYEMIVSGSATTMRTEINKVLDTVRTATKEMNNLFNMQDKLTNQRELAKAKIAENQAKFKELEAKGGTMATNPEMRRLHDEANKLREDNKLPWENLIGYNGNVQSNIPTMDSTIKNLLTNTVGSLVPKPLAAVGAGINLAMNVYGNPDSSVVSGIKQAGSDLAKQFKDILKKKGS